MWGIVFGLGFLVAVIGLTKFFDKPLGDGADRPKRKPLDPKTAWQQPVATMGQDSMHDIDVPILTDFDATRDIVTLNVAPPKNPKRDAQVLLEALQIVKVDGNARIQWCGQTVLIVDGIDEPIVALQPDANRAIFFDRNGKRIDRALVDVVLILDAKAKTAAL